MCKWASVWGLLLIASITLAVKQVLREEDFKEDSIRQLLETAVRKCNQYDNGPYWIKLDAILDGTKRPQMDETVVYNFKLRQSATNCQKDAILSNISKQPETSCATRPDSGLILCIVRAHETAGKEQPPEVTVESLWYQYPEPHVSTTTRKLTRKGAVTALNEKLLQLVRQYNQVSNTNGLLKFAGFDEETNQDSLGDVNLGTVYLNETRCVRSAEAAKNDEAEKDECFNELTGNVLRCSLIGQGENEDGSELINCDLNNTLVRGMWRSSKPQTKPEHKCADAVKKWGIALLDDQEVNSGIHKMHNFDRSNIRAVGADELEQTPYREIVEHTVMEYNKRSNDTYMYSLHKVENVKQETESEMALTFTMIVQRTMCIKTDELLENTMKFREQCRGPVDQPQLQLCHVTVTGDFHNGYHNGSFSFQGCRPMNSSSWVVLGGVQRIDSHERESEDFKQLVQRVISHYNSHNNSVLLYALESVHNVTSQVVSGKQIKMNLLMRATGCKEIPLDCPPAHRGYYLHCDVTVIQQPWISLEMINITNCWHRIKLPKTIKGTWDTPSLDYLKRPETQKMIAATVVHHNQIFNATNITKLDHVSKFRKLEVDNKRLYKFNLHLKGGQQNEVVRKCKVVFQEPNELDKKGHIAVSSCAEKKRTSTRMPVGKPRMLTDDEHHTEEFQALTKRVFSKFHQVTEDAHYHRLLSIINATVQVVAGKLTVLHMQLQRTECRKEIDDHLFKAGLYHECGMPNHTHVTICKASIWSKPWKNFEEITIEECQETKLRTPIYVQSKGSDPRSLKHFRQLIKNVEAAFNLESVESVFIETHLVENIKFEGTENGEYKFVHMLKPTNCFKWKEAAYFYDEQAERCEGHTIQFLVTCETSVKVKGKMKTTEEVTLENCQYIHAGEFTSRRPMTGPERSSTEFVAIKDRAVNIFNTKTYSSNWHTLFDVERPTVEFIAGKQVAFTLFMLPTLCRSSMPSGEDKSSKPTACSQTTLKYMVSCKVRYWVRPWSEQHETIDVKDCIIIPTEEISLTKVAVNRQLEENRHTLECLRSLLPNMLDTFDRKRRLSFDYESTSMDNVEQQTVAGKRFTFDLFVKSKPDPATCYANSTLNETCQNEISFHHCKASIWLRPWQGLVVHDLINCMRIVAKIEGITPEMTIPLGIDYNETLEELTQKALKLYDNISSDDAGYALGEIHNLTHQFHFGIKTAFVMKMVPLNCSTDFAQENCYDEEAKPYVRCQVTYWQRPWMVGLEWLSLDDCRQRYGFQSTPGVQPLSSQERNSVQFQQFVAKLVEMYKPSVPIMYTADTLEDAKVQQNEEERNVSFSLRLKPSGCNHTLPQADSPTCKNWQTQDTVKCDAQIVEKAPFGGSVQLLLKNCQTLWKAHPRRTLTSDELLELWFQNSVATAWKIYGKINPDTHLYTVSSVTDATTERDEEEVTLYSIEFTRTDCLKEKDEGKFSYGAANDCHISVPTTKANCSVKSTRHTDGRQSVVLNC